MDKAKLKEVRAKIKATTRDLKDITKQKRAASYKYLSAYSKKLLDEDYNQAIGKQMDAIFELIPLGLTQTEMEKIVRIDTTM